MASATLTRKGQVIIPAEIRARYELTPGTQVEFVDEGGSIRLIVRRRISPSVPESGYGMLKAKAIPMGGRPRRLGDFDPAALLGAKRSKH